MCGRVLISAAAFIIALLAVFLALPESLVLFGNYQDDVHSYLGPFMSLFTTCPFHQHAPKPSVESMSSNEHYNIVRSSLVAEERLFTKPELAQFNGVDGSTETYLAILGLVFDVSSGKSFYQTGGSYGFFAGKDGTRAFVTGDFTDEGLIEDISGLSSQQMLEIERWVKFYDEKYVFKGILHGHFYDAQGRPTEALRSAERTIQEGHAKEESRAMYKQFFPHCNTHWSEETGGVVWCSEKSGGTKRDWVGVPRKFHQPGLSSSRCACVRTSGPPYDNPDSDANTGDLLYHGLKEYDGCDPTAVQCQLPKI